MSNKWCCKFCPHCTLQSRSKIIHVGTIYETKGRGRFYCTDGYTDKKRDGKFICFGTNEEHTKPTIKTAPRWCSLNEVQ